MGAIVLDTSKVNSYVLPSLSKTKNTMQDAYSTSVSLRNSLPSSFNYRSTINEISNQIYNIKREINDIEVIVTKKIETAKMIETKQSSKLDGIFKSLSVLEFSGDNVSDTKNSFKTGVTDGFNTIGKKEIINEAKKAFTNAGSKIVEKFSSLYKSIGNEIEDLGISKAIVKTSFKAAITINKAELLLCDEIKEIYEKGWAGKLLVKAGASALNLGQASTEGVVSLLESIVDTGITLAGACYTGKAIYLDVATGIINGDWSWKATGTLWKEIIMPITGFDFTGKAVKTIYGEEVEIGNVVIKERKTLYSVVNEYAFDGFKKDEIAWDITKGVTKVAMIILITIATVGFGGPAAGGGAAAAEGTSATASIAGIMSSTEATWISTILSGVSKFGESSQSSYNNLSEEEKQSGAKIAGVLGSSTIKGLVEAATWFLTYGNGKEIFAGSKNKILSKIGTTFGGGKDIENEVVQAAYKKATTSIFSDATLLSKIPKADTATFAKAGMQGLKEYANAGADAIVTGEYDFDEATKKAIVSGSTSFVYDNTVGAVLSKATKSSDDILKARQEEEAKKAAEKAFSNVEKTIAEPADELAKQGVGKLKDKFFDSVNNVLANSNTGLNFVQSAGGKKIVGKGIKDAIKEGENWLIDFFGEKIAN